MLNKVNEIEFANLLSVHLSLIDEIADTEKRLENLRSENARLFTVVEDWKEICERHKQRNNDQNVDLENALIANEEKDKVISALRERNEFHASESARLTSEAHRYLLECDKHLKDVRRIDYIENQLVAAFFKIDSSLTVTFGSKMKSGTVRSQLDAYMVSNAQL